MNHFVDWLIASILARFFPGVYHLIRTILQIGGGFFR